jgi:hypothetical protein
VRAALLLAALAAFPAHADLYRWRDPQSGSIKYSNLPPPWYGDPAREIGAPRVEVVPDLSPRAGAPPAEAKAPAAKPAASAAGATSALESQFGALLQFFKQMPTRSDFDRTGAAFQQQAELYRAVSAELDRQDPAGAARRRALAQESGILDQLKKGLGALSSTKPPAQR